jgi:hypothetical protein
MRYASAAVTPPEHRPQSQAGSAMLPRKGPLGHGRSRRSFINREGSMDTRCRLEIYVNDDPDTPSATLYANQPLLGLSVGDLLNPGIIDHWGGAAGARQ